MKTEMNASCLETFDSVRAFSRIASKGHKQERRTRPTLTLQEILVPTDFSEHATQALNYAVSLAEKFSAKITLLHVIEPPISHSDLFFPGPVAPDQATITAGQLLAGICEREKVKRTRMGESMVRQGVPYEVISQTTKARNTDLIVIATHGRTGLARVFLGSTTEEVIRHAPCPVFVVRVQPSNGC